MDSIASSLSAQRRHDVSAFCRIEAAGISCQRARPGWLPGGYDEAYIRWRPSPECPDQIVRSLNGLPFSRTDLLQQRGKVLFGVDLLDLCALPVHVGLHVGHQCLVTGIIGHR